MVLRLRPKRIAERPEKVGTAKILLTNRGIKESDSDHVTAQQRSFGRLLVGDIIRLTPGLMAQLVDGFVVNTVLGVYLPPQAMGLYTLFWLTQAYVADFVTGWLRTAIIRFLPENPYHLRRFIRFAFITILVVGALGTLVAVVLAMGQADKFRWAHLAWTVAIFCGLSFFLTFQCALRGLFEQSHFSASAVLLVLTKVLLLLVFLPNATDRVATALMAMALSYVPPLIWQWKRLRQMDKQRASRDVEKSGDGPLLRRSLVYGMPLTVSLFIINWLQTGDRYLLATLVDLKELGIYTFWMGIGLQMKVYRIIFTALGPRLFQMNQADPARAKHYVQRLIGVYMLIAAPLLTALGLLLPPILVWLKINPQYAPASHLVFYGMGIAFFLGLVQLCGKEREFAEKTAVFMQAAVPSVLVMVAGVYVLTPLVGLDGAAIATLAGFGLHFFIVAFAARTWPTLADVLTSASSSLALFVIYHWAAHTFGSLVGMMAVGLIFSCYGLWTMRRAWRNRLQKTG